MGLEKKTKFTSFTSELYGLVQETPQRNNTFLSTVSMRSQTYSYWILWNYREAYGRPAMAHFRAKPHAEENLLRAKLRITNAALARKCPNMVTLMSMIELMLRLRSDARMMLQQDEAKDYVIATGKNIRCENLLRVQLRTWYRY